MYDSLRFFSKAAMVGKGERKGGGGRIQRGIREEGRGHVCWWVDHIYCTCNMYDVHVRLYMYIVGAQVLLCAWTNVTAHASEVSSVLEFYKSSMWQVELAREWL